MDFLNEMKAETERKKRQLQDSNVLVPGKKYFKRSDLAAKDREEYIRKHYQVESPNKPQESQTMGKNQPEKSKPLEEEKVSQLLRKEFQRLGRKEKYNIQDIEIIDVRVDDQLDPMGLMKGLTQEIYYAPHHKKDNLPSVQQRRKKQIQYLAFQAKERELELKNMWAQNKMNKNHLRSKYGF